MKIISILEKKNKLLDHNRVMRFSEKITEYIATKCDPWLQAIDGPDDRVYRGIPIKKAKSDLVAILPVRSDRKPRDTHPDRHALFDAMLELVGSKANRSNSAFVTGKFSEAVEYGQPYVFIPIGEFSYTWSPIYSDWTNDLSLQEILHNYSDEPEKEWYKTMYSAAEKNWEFDVLALKKAIEYYSLDKVNNEWKIKSKQRELDNHLDDKGKQRYINNAIDEFMSREGYGKYYTASSLNTSLLAHKLKPVIKVDQGLVLAIHRKVEIMIACQKGLYINPYIYEFFIIPYLNGEEPETQYSQWAKEEFIMSAQL